MEGLAQKMERWMHRQVATVKGGAVLELGAGTLNHLKFEQPGIEYDIVEPFEELCRGRPELARIRNKYACIADIPSKYRYRRIVSIAVLEHMHDLPREMAEAALKLDEDGVFQAGIPTEGGALWWLGWRFSTGISYYLRTGLDYGVLMRHEHVNTADEIIYLARHLFGSVAIRRFPCAGQHFSFYTYVEARRPDRDRCSAIMANSR